jgi:O-antigen biosynthesis protein
METSSENRGSTQFAIKELIYCAIDRAPYILPRARLNLVIPWISETVRHFGGLATALRLLTRLSEEFEYLRLVVTHETEAAFVEAAWAGWVLDRNNPAKRSIAFLGNGPRCLSITTGDLFVATFWSTSLFVRQILEAQVGLYGCQQRRYVYLIQEYEPDFYAGSARKSLARSTYDDRGSVIAIYNSKPVADYFSAQQLHFSEEYTFDPMLNPDLKRQKAALGTIKKERVILVYARPSVPQNDFDLVVDSLKLWSERYAKAGDWSVVSAGLPHDEIPLGKGVVIRSAGTLKLEDYAKHLARAWLGLSFTFNASTSYSSREMAEFGALVVTNQFEYRKQAELPSSVFTVTPPTPSNIASELAWCCAQYPTDGTAAFAQAVDIFKSGGEEFPFVSELLRSWRAFEG